MYALAYWCHIFESNFCGGMLVESPQEVEILKRQFLLYKVLSSKWFVHPTDSVRADVAAPKGNMLSAMRVWKCPSLQRVVSDELSYDRKLLDVFHCN